MRDRLARKEGSETRRFAPESCLRELPLTWMAGGRRKGRGRGKAGAGGRTRLVSGLRTESRPFGVVGQSNPSHSSFDGEREREPHSRLNFLDEIELHSWGHGDSERNKLSSERKAQTESSRDRTRRTEVRKRPRNLELRRRLLGSGRIVRFSRGRTCLRTLY